MITTTIRSIAYPHLGLGQILAVSAMVFAEAASCSIFFPCSSSYWAQVCSVCQDILWVKQVLKWHVPQIMISWPSPPSWVWPESQLGPRHIAKFGKSWMTAITDFLSYPSNASSDAYVRTTSKGKASGHSGQVMVSNNVWNLNVDALSETFRADRWIMVASGRDYLLREFVRILSVHANAALFDLRWRGCFLSFGYRKPWISYIICDGALLLQIQWWRYSSCNIEISEEKEKVLKSSNC